MVVDCFGSVEAGEPGRCGHPFWRIVLRGVGEGLNCGVSYGER